MVLLVNENIHQPDGYPEFPGGLGGVTSLLIIVLPELKHILKLMLFNFPQEYHIILTVFPQDS